MLIWAKVMKGDKILLDAVRHVDDGKSYTMPTFKKLMQDVSHDLDVSTPVIVPSHFKHFAEFHRVKFKPQDFIEDVNFSALVVEAAAEERNGKRLF